MRNQGCGTMGCWAQTQLPGTNRAFCLQQLIEDKEKGRNAKENKRGSMSSQTRKSEGNRKSTAAQDSGLLESLGVVQGRQTVTDTKQTSSALKGTWSVCQDMGLIPPEGRCLRNAHHRREEEVRTLKGDKHGENPVFPPKHRLSNQFGKQRVEGTRHHRKQPGWEEWSHSCCFCSEDVTVNAKKTIYLFTCHFSKCISFYYLKWGGGVHECRYHESQNKVLHPLVLEKDITGN